MRLSGELGATEDLRTSRMLRSQLFLHTRSTHHSHREGQTLVKDRVRIRNLNRGPRAAGGEHPASLAMLDIDSDCNLRCQQMSYSRDKSVSPVT